MLIVAMLHGWFWHPLAGQGYQFWSGIGSDAGEVSIFAAVAVWIRSRNCHVRRCWRLQWHTHPDHGHPVCRAHHPHGHGRLDEIPTAAKPRARRSS